MVSSAEIFGSLGTANPGVLSCSREYNLTNWRPACEACGTFLESQRFLKFEQVIKLLNIIVSDRPTDRPFAICLDVAGFPTFSLRHRELNASVSCGGHHHGHRENDPAGRVPGLGLRPEPAGPDGVQPGPAEEVRAPPASPSRPPGCAGQTTPPSSAGQSSPPPPPATAGIRGHRQPGLRQAAT